MYRLSKVAIYSTVTTHEIWSEFLSEVCFSNEFLVEAYIDGSCHMTLNNSPEQRAKEAVNYASNKQWKSSLWAELKMRETMKCPVRLYNNTAKICVELTLCNLEKKNKQICSLQIKHKFNKQRSYFGVLGNVIKPEWYTAVTHST